MNRRMVFVVPAVVAALAVASAAGISNPDYFWHLATGRWIVEHGQLPGLDPFGVASAQVPWINGEWLFQVALYAVHSVAGHAGPAVVLAATIGILFGVVFVALARRSGLPLALLVTLVSWYGAWEWLRERPATLGALFLVLLLFVLRSKYALAGVAVLTAVWINVHPSALLAPVVCGLYVLGEAAEERKWEARFLAPLVALAALFVNPYGIEAIRAPLHLAGVVELFRNEEWAPSMPAEFPLFWVALLAGGLLIVKNRPRFSSTLIFLFVSALAIRYCRNQGLFWSMAPLLLSFPPLPRRLGRLVAVASVVAFFGVLAGAHFSLSVSERRFPVAAVERLRASGLQGNVYTRYGMGGFLIWSFYPERRVVTDGRNELYVDYEREHSAALVDGRRWRALIERYDLRLAVFPRRNQSWLGVGQRRVPATAAYFPARRWALIASDEAALVFARRDAFPPATLRRLELPRRGF